MAVHYRTLGFILKKEDRGETDQLFTVYTQDFGKLEILGKAIRKIKSKLRSGADLFCLSEIEFIQGKTYKTLTDAVLIEKFKNIRSNLERLEIVYKIADALDSLIQGQEKEEKIWELLNEVFKRLNSAKLEIGNWKLEIIYYYFLWNLLSILGYQINLYNCAICQKKLLPQKLYFNLKEGGIIDSNCFSKIKKGEEISPEIVKILRIFQKKDWRTLNKLKIEDFHKNVLKSITQKYLTFAKETISDS